jgi:hypothetical protein
MSRAFETWVAITLGILCVRVLDATSSNDYAILILGLCWLAFSFWSAFKGLRGSL